MTDRAPEAAACPVCGEPAEWVEERTGKFEYGCVNNHTWSASKD